MTLESVNERFPKEIKLKKSEGKITLRLLDKNDAKALHEFFLSLPNYELMFAKQRVADLAVTQSWCNDIDWHKHLMIVAIQDDKIIGEISMHQRPGGWKRHIGEVNVHAHPAFRGKGLGKALANEMVDLAREMGLEYLEAEMVGKQESAIRMFGLLGFSELMRLPDYVKDMQANTHEYVVMGLRLVTDEEYAGAG
jgi:RimJ/RimL family protein N-acetyltransferase